MSEKYKFLNPDAIYSTTSTIVDWIDLFTRKEYCEIVADSLRYCQRHKGLVIHGWCLMPSHLHLIVSRRGKPLLPEILRDFKSYTNEKLIGCMGHINESRKDWLLRHFSEAAKDIKRVAHYKIWQDGNHPIELSTNEMIEQRIHYTHFNPVEAGIVSEPEYYIWSSAIDYAGGKGLLTVEHLD